MKTLFSRMLLAYLAIILALLLVLSFMVTGIFRNHYMNETRSELERELLEINSIIVEKYIYNTKRPVARDELLTIARKYDALIQLYFTDPALGRRDFFDEQKNASWRSCEYADLSDWADRIIAGEAHGNISYNMLSPYTSVKTATVMSAITTKEGKTLGAIFLHYDMTGVYHSINRIYLDTAASAAAAVAVVVPIVYVITKNITRPVSHIREVVTAFTGGKFERRVELKHDDELGQLGRSFNLMADELASLEETRRSFVANVSHELRSPLTSMRGFLEAMEDGTIPADEHDKYIEIVLDETRRMSGMVNELLDVARIESGQYKLNFSVFDINELIRRVIITFETRVAAKGLNVDISSDEDPIMVDADRDRIGQVLHNLIDNSIKFSRQDGGCIGVRCRCDKHLVYISVSDNGCGIPEKDLPHIFDRFYKANRAHTYANHSGTGIGLSIAKLVLEQHGQQISVSSDENGTEFTFTLSRSDQRRRAADRQI